MWLFIITWWNGDYQTVPDSLQWRSNSHMDVRSVIWMIFPFLCIIITEHQHHQHHQHHHHHHQASSSASSLLNSSSNMGSSVIQSLHTNALWPLLMLSNTEIAHWKMCKWQTGLRMLMDDRCQSRHVVPTQQTHHAIITSLSRHHGVILTSFWLKMTSFRHYNDFIITSCVQWEWS